MSYVVSCFTVSSSYREKHQLKLIKSLNLKTEQAKETRQCDNNPTAIATFMQVALLRIKINE
jgi:hypothetical protein